MWGKDSVYPSRTTRSDQVMMTSCLRPLQGTHRDKKIDRMMPEDPCHCHFWQGENEEEVKVFSLFKRNLW
jgi:hypothetical protein